jgi:protein-S-isoprenylcysteine O-methyltransferase Ste14
MPPYVYWMLLVGWLLWMIPFFLIRRGRPTASTIDRRARWGIGVQVVAFSLVWQGRFWLRQPAVWRIWVSAVLLGLAALLTWTSTRTLGRQWRVDAGLNEDHQLVTAGAYRLIRHPIYASMLCMLLGTGTLLAPWFLFLPAIVLFLVGIEIRVRVEDGLLAGRFGDRFDAYRRQVAAYIPYIR